MNMRRTVGVAYSYNIVMHPYVLSYSLLPFLPALSVENSNCVALGVDRKTLGN